VFYAGAQGEMSIVQFHPVIFAGLGSLGALALFPAGTQNQISILYTRI